MVKGDFSTATKDYDPAQSTVQHFNRADTDDAISKALYTDFKSYLPGDILVKVDRMSMANSLECRAPLLDYRVVEFAASLSMDKKRYRGTSKYILKKTLGKMLPDSILHRKKVGFESPVASWMRTSLRPTYEQIVFSSTAANREFFISDHWNRCGDSIRQV